MSGLSWLPTALTSGVLRMDAKTALQCRDVPTVDLPLILLRVEAVDVAATADKQAELAAMQASLDALTAQHDAKLAAVAATEVPAK